MKLLFLPDDFNVTPHLLTLYHLTSKIIYLPATPNAVVMVLATSPIHATAKAVTQTLFVV